MTELLLAHWRDVLDILLVAIIIYNLLLLIRGTRSVPVVVGMLALATLYSLAGLARLFTLNRILDYFVGVLPIAVVVLFQHEIRRALARVGRNPLWGLATHEKLESTINDIVLAATALAARKTGALIVIQRLEGLRNYAENGIELDAVVTYDLLINIFHPETPLHDGAAIIQNDRIAAAACFLPLTLNSQLSKELGTRHRAALGISEETDALAIAVSEESGLISIAFGGELIRGLEGKELRNMLFKYILTNQEPEISDPE